MISYHKQCAIYNYKHSTVLGCLRIVRNPAQSWVATRVRIGNTLQHIKRYNEHLILLLVKLHNHRATQTLEF